MKLTLLVLVLAPLPFWILGLPWVQRGDPGRVRLAPLIGCALSGLYAELALIFGLPVRAAIAVVMLASAAFIVADGRRALETVRRAGGEWLPYYFLSVLAASISAYPVLGAWSGDWFLLFQMGESLVHGALGPDMLARPPLFGAAAAPLWILASGMIPYQLMAAVASAATVTAMLFFIDHFWPKSPRFVLLPLLLSPFFLHHTAAAWGKLLAAGLILAAFIEGLRGRRIASGALYALAVAVHEGSILWVSVVLLAQLSGRRGWREALRSVGALAACGLIIAGPLQIWILLKYGLAAKISSNPVITQRDSMPFAVKSVLAVVTSFVGWGPFSSLSRWIQNPHPLSLAVASKEAYWLIASWITTLAGTIAGVLFPFLVVPRARLASPVASRLLQPWTLAALGFPVLVNALIVGQISNEGSMQGVLAPLALGLYCVLAGQLANSGPGSRQQFRRMAWVMGIVGTLPWLAANLMMSAGIRFSAGFRQRMMTASETDYFLILDHHLKALGMTAFPEVPLLCALALVVYVLLGRRRQRGGFTVEPKA